MINHFKFQDKQECPIQHIGGCKSGLTPAGAHQTSKIKWLSQILAIVMSWVIIQCTFTENLIMHSQKIMLAIWVQEYGFLMRFGTVRLSAVVRSK